MGHIADMIAAGWNVVVTHGNGPQVGFILRRSELALHELHPVPLDYCGADTQGAIGYMFQKALRNHFMQRGLQRQVATVVTQVLVDNDDPGFAAPNKPIGSFVDETVARERMTEGQQFVEDAGRGWRRVVASPQPQAIMEKNVIETLIAAGVIVIAVGGGGIPVIEREDGSLKGVEAVIDKDRASSLLANVINADLLLISTAVEKVAIHFKTSDETWLDKMTIAEAKQYLAEGHFAPGSMAPKVEACIAFIERGGRQALITNPANMTRALNGETGTWIVP
jgi:carbamate kinase